MFQFCNALKENDFVVLEDKQIEYYWGYGKNIYE